MKQSCRLVKSVLAASSRFGSAKSRQTPMERSRTIGWSILLNQPMNWVVSWRGMRLVSKKVEVLLHGDAGEDRAKVHGSVHGSGHVTMRLLFASRGVRRMSWPVYIAGAAALAGALPRAEDRAWSCRRRSIRRCAGTRAWGASSRRWCRSTSTTTRSSSAPTTRPTRSPTQRHAGFMRLAALYRERFAKSAAMTDDAKESISDLQFTACLPRAVPVQPLRAPAPARRLVRGVVVGRAGHRSRRQQPLRPDRARTASTSSATTSTRSASTAAPSACARSARCWAPTTRWSRTTCAACARSRGSTRCRSTCRAPRR